MSANEVPSSPFLPDLFAGQVAFVTGGATGIGKEICRVLGRHGARIAIASRKQEALDAAAEELRGEGIEMWTRSCDVRDAAPRSNGPSRRSSITTARLDIVVNNAAGNFPVPLANLSPNGFKSVVDIDLLGTYNVSKAAFDVWLEAHGGNVVNITAPYELKGAALQAHVAAAKAGVDSLTRTCAVEWGHYGIRVNAIAPGAIAGAEGVRRFAAATGSEEKQARPRKSGGRRRSRRRHRAHAAVPLQPGGAVRVGPGHRGRRCGERRPARDRRVGVPMSESLEIPRRRPPAACCA